MSTRSAERPVETEDEGFGEKIRSHPAFGVIQGSRCSGGGMTLAGSPIKHNAFITIRISHATERVSFTHSQFHASAVKGLVTELVLSEAQWASFVSSLNIGGGVPCTITYERDGSLKQVPAIEDSSFEEKRADDIKTHIKKQDEQLKAAVAHLDAMIAEGKVSKKELKTLRSMFTQPVDNNPSNMAFLSTLLTEHVENLVTSAKAEVAAMVTQAALEYPRLENTVELLPDEPIKLLEVDNEVGER